MTRSARVGGRGHASQSRHVDGRGHRQQQNNSNNRVNSKRVWPQGVKHLMTIATIDETKMFRSNRDFTEENMLSFGLSLLGLSESRQQVCDRTNLERYRAHYGIGPKATVASYLDIREKFQTDTEDFKVKYFLMSLCFLKLYETEHVMSARWGYHEEVCRKIVVRYLKRIQRMKSIKIQFKFQTIDGRRILGYNFVDSDGRTYLGTIDCVHCECNEFRTSPDSIWYSHKHNGAGVSYEIIVDLQDDKVVSVSGPYPASYHDITIFRGGKSDVSKDRWDQRAMYFKIPESTRLIGDSGYSGEPNKISTTMPDHTSQVKKYFARAKSRQETFNTRLKFFGVLSQRFRHGKGHVDKLKQHKRCFEAVCVLVQYDLENGHPLMDS